MEKNLKSRPTRCLEEAPCARGENESIPGSDSQSADKEILVSVEMGWQIQGRRQQISN